MIQFLIFKFPHWMQEVFVKVCDQVKFHVHSFPHLLQEHFMFMFIFMFIRWPPGASEPLRLPGSPGVSESGSAGVSKSGSAGVPKP